MLIHICPQCWQELRSSDYESQQNTVEDRLLATKLDCVFNVKSTECDEDQTAESACFFIKAGHTPSSHTNTLPYLGEVQVEEAECEELQADGAAVEQPVGQRLQLVGLHHIFKVERKEGRPQRCPQQAQKQKHTLVAEALVPVVQNEPELQVHENKQEGVQDCVDRS